MKLILTKHGQEIVVDDDIYEQCNNRQWRVDKGGYARNNPWVNGKTVTVYLHRLVMKADSSKTIVDHINGDKLDNQRSNLRFVTQEQNKFNRKATVGTPCPYKGVTINSSSKRPYKADIFYRGVHHYLGVFATAEEAAQAYNEGSLKYHGEYGRLNVIPVPSTAV